MKKAMLALALVVGTGSLFAADTKTKKTERIYFGAKELDLLKKQFANDYKELMGYYTGKDKSDTKIKVFVLDTVSKDKADRIKAIKAKLKPKKAAKNK